MARSKGKRLAAILLSVALMVSGAMILEPLTASAATIVRVAQATSNEIGKTRDGEAGDQTGREVSFDKWTYSAKDGAYNNWKYVVRAKDPAIAKQLAEAMKKACLNDHIGYDQAAPDRFSCYDEAKAIGWDIAKIEVDCETTCTSIISVCLNSIGIKTARYWDSSLMYNDLKATGKFNFYTSSEYTASSDLLEIGDILISPGKHSCVVVESPNSPGSTLKTTSTKGLGTASFKAGKDYQLNHNLYVRTGPGSQYTAKPVSQLTEEAQMYSRTYEGKARLKKGAVVTCIKTSGEWIMIPSGWIRGKNGKTIYLDEYKETAAQKNLYESAKNTPSAPAATAASTASPASSSATKTTSTASASSTATKTSTTTTTKTTTTSATTKTTTTSATANTTASNKVVVKKGNDYVLKMVLNVRTGPGTKYKNVKRSSLTKDAKKHATSSSKAKLKKGTVVTCLQVKGDWMRIPSGWICCKQGNVAETK